MSQVQKPFDPLIREQEARKWKKVKEMEVFLIHLESSPSQTLLLCPLRWMAKQKNFQMIHFPQLVLKVAFRALLENVYMSDMYLLRHQNLEGISRTFPPLGYCAHPLSADKFDISLHSDQIREDKRDKFWVKEKILLREHLPSFVLKRLQEVQNRHFDQPLSKMGLQQIWLDLNFGTCWDLRSPKENEESYSEFKE